MYKCVYRVPWLRRKRCCKFALKSQGPLAQVARTQALLHALARISNTSSR